MRPAEYLVSKGIEFDERGENLVFNCPFCGDTEKKAAMHVESGVFNCMHQNKCGEKGTFWYFQHKMGDTPTADYSKDVRHAKKAYSRPENKGFKSLSQEHTDYLHGRGFTDKTINHFELRSKGKEIAIPYKKNGELVGVKYRTTDKQFRKEKNAEPVLFNRDNVKAPLVICEGEFDAMAWFEYGLNVASVPDGASGLTWIENEWDWLEQFEKIFISMDMDAAGRRAVEVMAERLGLWRCYNVKLPFKDAAECLSHGVEKVVMDAAVKNADGFEIQGIGSPLDYLDGVVARATDVDYGKGLKTPFESLNRMLKGWRWGELTVWSGRNGSGKTTVLNQVVIDLIARHDVNVFIASLEMKPDALLYKFVQQMGAEEDIETALRGLQTRLYLMNKLGKVEPDYLLGLFEFAARKHGCKHFIVDSLMRIAIDRASKYDAQEEFVNDLVGFAQKFDVHVHLVAHPRKGMTDDDRPGKVDISGSGDITNLAHNVLILYRPTPEKKMELVKKGDFFDAELFLRKNREFGQEGSVKLEFSIARQMYSEWRRGEDF